MKRVLAVTAVLMLLSLSIATQANITIETVAIGDAGNSADTLVQSDGTSGYGSVGYNYNIGKYEVTAGQYAAFLNAVASTDTYKLYNGYSTITRNGTSGNYNYSVVDANRPAVGVTYWSACRFVNWLCNGQLTGEAGVASTEYGAYTLDGYNGQDGRAIQRNAGAKWAITSEDEWYKAAYYKGNGTNSGYWLYPTMSNTINTNMANYNDSIGNATDVGIYPNHSAYGTYDQGGNVWEWNESVIVETSTQASRAQRGGCFGYIGSVLRASWRGGSYYPANSNSVLGFRVVQAVPEPSSLISLAGGLVGILGMRRRKA